MNSFIANPCDVRSWRFDLVFEDSELVIQEFLVAGHALLPPESVTGFKGRLISRFASRSHRE